MLIECLTFCCSKLCDSSFCCAHVTPRFARVCSVENQISMPMTRVSSAVTAIMNPVIFKKTRFVDRTAPGSEMRKLVKVNIPAATTP